MVNFFDRLYTSIQDRNKILTRIKYYSLLRIIVRVSANICIRFYYKITQWNDKYSLEESHKNQKKLIVSLTSFPARINLVWIVIESLLRQTVRPDSIILWLSNEQFPAVESLPNSLRKLQTRGLTIRLCSDDLKSHKKYFYAMQEFPESQIVTVDDDVFYNSNLLAFLIEFNKKFPQTICCNHASSIVYNSGEVAAYSSWRTIKNNSFQFPTIRIMPIGVGGILYPPNSLNSDVFNVSLLKKHCFYADDIWLNAMARIHGTKSVKTNYYSSYIPIINFRNKTLHSININEGLNDAQLKSLRAYFLANNQRDPFEYSESQ